ncbi:MAG: hypothetical protein AMJ78_01650 [Omnitrophica WOR_2 bacterium SM23_29]|nr:MAG: hypothetical protein AMJ78_01650 [Omnitrophica WOR_2 bacterium SM23_29]
MNINARFAGIVIAALRKKVYGMQAAVVTKNPNFLEKRRLIVKYRVTKVRGKEKVEKNLAINSRLKPSL